MSTLKKKNEPPKSNQSTSPNVRRRVENNQKPTSAATPAFDGLLSPPPLAPLFVLLRLVGVTLGLEVPVEVAMVVAGLGVPVLYTLR